MKELKHTKADCTANSLCLGGRDGLFCGNCGAGLEQRKPEYNNYHLIEVRYLGATNTKGSRVKMISSRFEQSITIPYNYEFNSGRDIALDWLSKHGHNVIGSGDVGGRDVVVIAASGNLFKKLKEV